MYYQNPSLILQSTCELHNVLFDAMSDGVLVVDRRGVILDCNPAFHHQLGYEKSELIGKTVQELDTPEFADQVPERIQQLIKDGQVTFESAHYRKDGSVMPVEINAHHIDVDGEVVFFSIVRDLTLRKDLEANHRESLEVYQAAINTPALGFWVVDMQGRFLEINDAYVQLSGYTREELLAMAIPDIEASEKPEETAAHIESITQSGYDRFRTLHRRKDGTTWPAGIVVSYSPIQGGRFFVFIEDITRKVIQENRLALASRVFENIDQAVVITDAQNRIISINPATTSISGYTFEEVQGKDPNIFSSGLHRGTFYESMWEALNSTGHWEGEIWDRRKDGSVYTKWQTINAIHDHQGEVSQYVSIFSDITERKKTEELIWRQANFDALTGLPNRHLLHERLEQEIKKARRTGQPLAVLFIDLDHFKEVNDTLGHAKGDSLLVQAADRINAHIRETDTIARLGGDEFTLVLPEFDGQDNLERICQELIQELAEPFDLGDDERIYISASIGITIYPDDAHNLEGLLKHADQAMYKAKAEGRNRYGYFTLSMQEEAREKLELTNELRSALPDNQLQVYYQPIIDLASGEIVKTEALLRWHHPERGIINPSVFIPLAENSGLIHDISNWVFSQAISCIAHWRQQYGRIIPVSVNKSPIQFEKSLESSWQKQLAELGLPGNSIVIEITEGSLLSKSRHIKERLLEFRNAGIEISIDDFGTGFSALSYLHQFDIDYLKIDRSFIADLAENSAHKALTEAIIVMAHKLGIRTIAEGVETETQRKLLQSFGCDYAQGFLYARPLPAKALEQLLMANIYSKQTLENN